MTERDGHALTTLIRQVNAYRELIAQVDQLLLDEFGGMYESAPDSPLATIRELLRDPGAATDMRIIVAREAYRMGRRDESRGLRAEPHWPAVVTAAITVDPQTEENE